MKSKKNIDNKAIFFPYYINQSRLLDIYSILNDGYSEYIEITTSVTRDKDQKTKGEVSTGAGFKLLNIGGTFSSNTSNRLGLKGSNTERKVQTITSILSLVRDNLQSKGYLKDIKEITTGIFVELPVTLRINSIKLLLSEIKELFSLYHEFREAGLKVQENDKKIVELEKAIKSFRNLFSGEEIFYETSEYAIIGNISDENLYQSQRTDLLGTELKCLAQVKRIFPNGAELMQNTILAKVKDSTRKEDIVGTLMRIIDYDDYAFEATVIPAVKNKPVYQLEIIALYQ